MTDSERIDAIIQMGLDVCVIVKQEDPGSSLFPTVSIELDSREAIDRAIRLMQEEDDE